MKSILLVVLLLFLSIITVHSGEAEQLIINLENVPENELAICTVKTNDFQFFCWLNRQNYYNCKVGLGTKFTLPKCKPVACVPCTKKETEPISVVKPKVSNPFIDLLLKKK